MVVSGAKSRKITVETGVNPCWKRRREAAKRGKTGAKRHRERRRNGTGKRGGKGVKRHRETLQKWGGKGRKRGKGSKIGGKGTKMRRKGAKLVENAQKSGGKGTENWWERCKNRGKGTKSHRKSPKGQKGPKPLREQPEAAPKSCEIAPKRLRRGSSEGGACVLPPPKGGFFWPSPVRGHFPPKKPFPPVSPHFLCASDDPSDRWGVFAPNSVISGQFGCERALSIPRPRPLLKAPGHPLPPHIKNPPNLPKKAPKPPQFPFALFPPFFFLAPFLFWRRFLHRHPPAWFFGVKSHLFTIPGGSWLPFCPIPLLPPPPPPPSPMSIFFPKKPFQGVFAAP